MALTLRYAVRSDVGHVRQGNEDSAFAGPRLLAVADGMGGAAAGEVASQVAIASLAHLDDDAPGGDLLADLALALRQANERLRQLTAADPSLDGMGTTVTALLSAGSRLGIVHIGDSRAYLLRDGELAQITRDHTLVQQLVDEGQITLEEAGNHPQRSLILRALDGRGEVDLDLSVREAMVGDRYLLCSDGLSGVVSLETIRAALDVADPQEVVDRLVELALRGGGPDNITVVVADVIEESAGARALTAQVAGAAAIEPARDGPGYDTAAARAALLRTDGAGFSPSVPAPSSDPPGTPSTPVVAPPPGDQALAAGSAAARGNAIGSAQPATSDSARGVGTGGAHRASAPTQGSAGRRRITPLLRRPAVLLPLVVVLVLVLGGASAWAYVRGQYYVGADDGRVAVFRGLSGSFAGLSLHQVVSRSDIAVDQLKDLDQQMVRAGITAHGRTDADNIVARLGGRAGAAQPVCPSPAPPTATTQTPPSVSSPGQSATGQSTLSTGTGPQIGRTRSVADVIRNLIRTLLSPSTSFSPSIGPNGCPTLVAVPGSTGAQASSRPNGSTSPTPGALKARQPSPTT